MFTDTKYTKELLTALTLSQGCATLFGATASTQYIKKAGQPTPTLAETKQGIMSYELYTFLRSINKINNNADNPVEGDSACFGTLLNNGSYWKIEM